MAKTSHKSKKMKRTVFFCGNGHPFSIRAACGKANYFYFGKQFLRHSFLNERGKKQQTLDFSNLVQNKQRSKEKKPHTHALFRCLHLTRAENKKRAVCVLLCLQTQNA